MMCSPDSPPGIHTVSFPVRYYECDAYHHLNHAIYIRLMGEAAFSASAMAGYPADRLEESGHVWLAREHEVEFIRPYLYGETVTIHTGIEDFRRVRSRRRYDFYNGEALAARAATDWVYIEKKSGKPVSVPAEMVADFRRLNGGGGAALPTRDPFPTPPPLPPSPFHHRMPVEWRDVDPQRHVNHASYLSYIENGTWALMQHRGWPLERLIERGFGIVARRFRILYLEPAVMGDELEVTTWVSDAKRATAVRHYTVHRVRDSALLMQARALWVWVDLVDGSPIRIPEDFRADFRPNFTE